MILSDEKGNQGAKTEEDNIVSFRQLRINRSRTRNYSKSFAIDELMKSFGSTRENPQITKDTETIQSINKNIVETNETTRSIVKKTEDKKFCQDVRYPGKLIVAFDPEIFCKSSLVVDDGADKDDSSDLEDYTSMLKVPDSKKREKFLAIWRYLLALIDFSGFTTSSLKDGRVNILFNEFIMLSNRLSYELSKWGPNFSDIRYAKSEKIEFRLINELIMEKLYKVFYTVFSSENMQPTHDCELNKKFLTIKSRLLEVFILLSIRTKNFPFETISNVIRELNRDPNILLHLIDENSSFEPSLFALEYRNFLKTACLIPSNLYTNKSRFISFYFPCFFYSLMGERLVSKSNLFSSLLSQCLQAIKDEMHLPRKKVGVVCTTFFSIYLDYKEISKNTAGKPSEDKNKIIRQALSPLVFQSTALQKPRRAMRGRWDMEASHASPNKSRTSQNFKEPPSPTNSLGTSQRENREDKAASLSGMIEPLRRQDSKGKDEEKSIEDNLSVRSNKSFINTFNDEYLKESDFEDTIKNIEEILAFSNEVLAGKNSEISRIQGINLLPVYLVLKLDQLLNPAIEESEKPDSSIIFNSILFKGFIKTIVGKEDLILQSFKIGEFLVYCFMMMVNCDWDLEEFEKLT